MSNTGCYRLFTKLDSPKRYLSLTVDELIVAIIGFSLLALTNYKVDIFLYVNEKNFNPISFSWNFD